AGLAQRPATLPLLPAAQQRLKWLELERSWSLAGLAREGEIIVVQACADDFNDVVPHPAVGRSIEIELRIVSKQKLAALLDEALTEVQQDIVRLHQWQEKAGNKVVAAQKQLENTGKLRQEDQDALVEAGQLQQQIRERIGPTPDDGLR